MKTENLTVGYGKRHLIEDVNVHFDDGGLVALIGRNGAGKSSLLRVLAGIDRPLSGKVMTEDRDLSTLTIAERARTIAFVTTQRVRIANLSCHDVVALGRAPYTDWIGRLSSADEAIVTDALEMVDMADYAHRTMDTMSDGECQRVMIARALAQDTKIILLDEPTSFLDLPNRYELCMLLQRLSHEKGKCVIFSTHELYIALSLCDTIALIDSPRLLVGTPKEMVDNGSIHRIFNFSKFRSSGISIAQLFNTPFSNNSDNSDHPDASV